MQGDIKIRTGFLAKSRARDSSEKNIGHRELLPATCVYFFRQTTTLVRFTATKAIRSMMSFLTNLTNQRIAKCGFAGQPANTPSLTLRL